MDCVNITYTMCDYNIVNSILDYTNRLGGDVYGLGFKKY